MSNTPFHVLNKIALFALTKLYDGFFSDSIY